MDHRVSRKALLAFAGVALAEAIVPATKSRATGSYTCSWCWSDHGCPSGHLCCPQEGCGGWGRCVNRNRKHSKVWKKAEDGLCYRHIHISSGRPNKPHDRVRRRKVDVAAYCEEQD